MAEYLIQDNTLKNLATAIREKAGITDEMTAEDMIKNIYLLETDTDTGAPAYGVTFYDWEKKD